MPRAPGLAAGGQRCVPGLGDGALAWRRDPGMPPHAWTPGVSSLPWDKRLSGFFDWLGLPAPSGASLAEPLNICCELPGPGRRPAAVPAPAGGVDGGAPALAGTSSRRGAMSWRPLPQDPGAVAAIAQGLFHHGVCLCPRDAPGQLGEGDGPRGP